MIFLILFIDIYCYLDNHKMSLISLMHMDFNQKEEKQQDEEYFSCS